jgi:hypothetical protein
VVGTKLNEIWGKRISQKVHRHTAIPDQHFWR